MYSGLTPYGIFLGKSPCQHKYLETSWLEEVLESQEWKNMASAVFMQNSRNQPKELIKYFIDR